MLFSRCLVFKPEFGLLKIIKKICKVKKKMSTIFWVYKIQIMEIRTCTHSLPILLLLGRPHWFIKEYDSFI